MSSNEYIAGFFGIMIGLSITELLRGIYETIINSKKVKYFIPHGIGLADCFLIIVIFFFDYFRVMRTTETWTPLTLVSQAFPLIIIFFLTMLAFPSFKDDIIDFKEHTKRIWPKLYLAGFAICVLLVLRNIFVTGLEPTSPINVSLYLQIPVYLLGWVYRQKDWIHYFITTVMFILLLGATMVYEI